MMLEKRDELLAKTWRKMKTVTKGHNEACVRHCMNVNTFGQ